MITLQAFVIALQQVKKNPLRAALTTLGVMIGVAAVIAMVLLGRGASAAVENQLAGMGQNLLFVSPGRPGMGTSRVVARPFTDADARALRQRVGGLAASSPVTGAAVRAVRAGASWSTVAMGITPDYLVALKWHVAAGRPFSDDEVKAGAAVCLLGETARAELFGGGDALGQEIRINGVVVTVVGVLAAKGRAASGMDPDDTLLVPLPFVHRRITGTDDVSTIVLSAADGEDTSRVQRDVIAEMRQLRHLRPDEDADFFVRDMKEIERMIGNVTDVLSSLLAAIASISLLVGGIGIMNIMLVSVSERTREIGLRLALGARARDVLLQFLVESIVLSTLGGAIGLVVGVGGSAIATQRLGMPLVFDANAAALPLVFSVVIGVLFGWLPARKAARMRPIEALRHET